MGSKFRIYTFFPKIEKMPNYQQIEYYFSGRRLLFFFNAKEMMIPYSDLNYGYISQQDAPERWVM